VLIFFKTFLTLGNNRPKILVQIEDCVLHAIVELSKGKSRDNTMDALYSQLFSLKDVLRNDEGALAWFDFATASSAIPSTPSPSSLAPIPFIGGPFDVFIPQLRAQGVVPKNLFNKVQGQCLLS
jgi:hypothetical protein